MLGLLKEVNTIKDKNIYILFWKNWAKDTKDLYMLDLAWNDLAWSVSQPLSAKKITQIPNHFTGNSKFIVKKPIVGSIPDTGQLLSCPNFLHIFPNASFANVINLLKPNVFITSIDLIRKYAFFSFYMDESCLQRDIYKSWPWQCHSYHAEIQKLTFIIHPEKSIIIPKQTTVCLEFFISSTNMALSLTDENKTKIKKISREIFYCNR